MKRKRYLKKREAMNKCDYIKNAQKNENKKLYIDKKMMMVYIEFVTTYRREKKKVKILLQICG